MELVGSRASDEVDHAAGGPTGLGSVAVGLDGDLLNTFDVRLDSDGADDALVIIDAINYPVIKAAVLPVHRKAGGVGAAIVRASTAAESVALPLIGAGDERHELDEVASVEWQVLHCLGRDGRADG